MKNILCLMILLCTVIAYGQKQESEPNNSFNTANFVPSDSSLSGSVNNTTDVYDYLRISTSNDGTVTLILSAKNTGVSTGYAYLYGYDSRKNGGQILAKYVANSSTVGIGVTVYDTINLYGMQRDSLYFRIEASTSFAYNFKYILNDISTNDSEPNNGFAEALPILENDLKQGHIGYYSGGGFDVSDYYRTVLKKDGTVILYIEGTNTSSQTGYMYLYSFDGRRNGGQILSKYVANNSTVGGFKTVYDTILLFGKAVDTLYFRLDGIKSFKYKIHYEIIDTSLNDAEPNNDFDEAITLNTGEIKVGHISYVASGAPDYYDYYRITPAKDGTIRLLLGGTNLGGGTGYMYFYGFDSRRNGGQILSKYVANNSTVNNYQNITDTIYLFGRAKDTLFFRLEANRSFKYSIQYEILDTSLNDPEPNNTFNTAISISHLEEKVGHVGYVSGGVSDVSDYYRSWSPKDGTVRLILSGTNLGGKTGYMYVYGFDGRKNGGQILSKYVANSSTVQHNQTVYDTIYLFGRASDTLYFRIDASTAFKYKIRYELIDTSQNDAEPNNTFAEAISIQHKELKVGHVGYIASGVNDASDYYKTVSPFDGTMRIIINGLNVGGQTGYMYIYAFDQRKNGGQILARYIDNNSTVAAYTTVTDTIYLFGRAVDTVYFRVDANKAFQYSIKYEILDSSKNDSEPNNTFDNAIDMVQFTKYSGHTGYFSAGVADAIDYYRMVLPDDGTVKINIQGINKGGGTGYMYVYGYDSRKGAGQIYARYLNNSSTIANDGVINDSIYFFCRGKDTVYLRIESNRAFQYQLVYQMIQQSPKDNEPNNTFSQSTNINVQNKYNGHLKYSFGTYLDDDDYYKIVIPPKGSLSLAINASNTGGGNGYLYLYMYDKRRAGGQIYANYVAKTSTVGAGQTIIDTIQLPCLTSDTVYLRFVSSSCFSYSFNTWFVDRQPVASTENERLGNTVGFRPKLFNATDFTWDFGDGTKSTLKFPLKTYGIGNYTARLIVTNSFCNFKDTASEDFEIKGIEYYTPDSSGSGGDASITFFGGGLDTSTTVYLSKGGTDFSPVVKFTNAKHTQLEAIFDLHLIDEGLYDLSIQIPGEPLTVYKNGFKVDKFRYPYTWSEVVAPSRWRINVDNKFKLMVGNKGNVSAAGVLVALAWPKTLDLKFDTKFFKPPASGKYTIDIDGKNYTFDYKDIQRYYADTFVTTTAIDSLNGKAFDGYIRILMIPRIGAGTTFEIPLIARATKSTSQNFVTYTFKPNLFGSCGSGSWADASENIAIEALDLLDMGVSASPALEKSPVGLLVKATKGTTKHMANLGQAMGAFYNYATGVTPDIYSSLPADYMQNVSAGNAQVGSAVLDFAIDKAAGKAMDNAFMGQTNRLNKHIATPGATSKSIEFAIDNINDINDLRQMMRDMYKGAKDLKTLNDKLNRLGELLKDCPELKKQYDELKDQLNKDMEIRNPKETKTNSVTSMDPNAIYGPAGVDNTQFINSGDRQPFLVTFENVDTAKAAAQIVLVRDTLDKTKFDLGTFEFVDYTVGVRTFNIPKGRKEFVLEDSLSPDMHVRVNGELDSSNGVITIQMTAIDPLTGDLPVFEGFLPPNVNKPEGEGSFSYTILPKLPLNDGTVFRNRASIVFDSNEPIMTNTWENILDINPPTSSVTATVNDTTNIITLRFTGSDATSGVGFYNLYVNVDDKEWLAFGGSHGEDLELTGEPGKTYGFYSVANDKVGNVESKMAMEESRIVMKPAAGKKLVIRPNPGDDVINIDGMRAYEEYRISDLMGRIILKESISNSDSIDVSMLKSGIYIVTVYGSDKQSMKLMKR
ncbi:MAG: T9SS type A sorting domain-containing protein [Flavobacteriales bacterium]|nr:T9SS type A sorting domain-containing protein [Flavobacteriales bacterium]